MARYLIISIMLIIPLLGLAGCSSDAAPSSEAHANMPDYVTQSAPKVQAAYVFAIEHPEDLEFQPCYCGCGAMGHINNLDCFVKEVRPNGEIIFDNHASGCGICVDIAQDVIRLKGEGKTALQIRQYVDAVYSAFGPSTDTPMPAGS